MKKIALLILLLFFGVSFIIFPLGSFAAQRPIKSVTQKKVLIKKTAKKKVAQKIAPTPKRAASVLLQSAHELRLTPGQTEQLRFGIKNTGTQTWRVSDLRFFGDQWPTTTTPVTAPQPIPSGRLHFFDVSVSAPAESGTFVIKLALYADDVGVSGTTISIPVEVSRDEAAKIVDGAPLLHEPRIRVSLGKIEGAVLVRTNGEYDFVAPDKSALLAVPHDTRVLWEYDIVGKTYLVTMNGVATTSPALYRMRARTSDGRVVVHDKNDRPKWNGSVNYNEFRGDLELRYSEKMLGLWVINELPMEQYLKGLIETTSKDPAEMQRAVQIAARTYAYVHLPDGVNYVNRLWDVHAVWDQYYKGYEAERINPTGARATDDTRGVLVLYEGRPVTTPYFARSNGSTKGWRAVWGGTDKPWLQPVDAKYDRGKKQFGHGVGMSQTDAKLRAKNDDWTYEQLLKYYYTGVDVRRVYE